MMTMHSEAVEPTYDVKLDGSIPAFPEGMATRPHNYFFGVLQLPAILKPAVKEDFLNGQGGKVLGKKFYIYYPWGNKPGFRVWHLDANVMWEHIAGFGGLGCLFVEK